MTDRANAEKRATDAAGESVTEAVLREQVGSQRLSQFLDKGEQPHHVLRGRLLDMFDRTGEDVVEESQTRKMPSADGSLFTVVTDRRVLFLVQRDGEPDQLSVSFADIADVEHETALGRNVRLRLRTDDREYLADTSASSEGAASAASEFIASRRESTSTVDDPLEQIEKLADLNERGILTDDEFEKKKAELLDRL